MEDIEVMVCLILSLQLIKLKESQRIRLKQVFGAAENGRGNWWIKKMDENGGFEAVTAMICLVTWLPGQSVSCSLRM